MRSYDTLSEAVNDLVKRGYTFNFNLKSDCIECRENLLTLFPEEFNVDEVYRFEGNSDPGDNNILFAISAPLHQLKGLLVNAYGAYSDSFSTKMMEKLAEIPQ